MSRLRVVFILLICLSCQACSSFAFWGRRQQHLQSTSSASQTPTSCSITRSATTTASSISSLNTTADEVHNTTTTNIERGKLLPSSEGDIKAKDLYSAYTEVQAEYQERAFADVNWKILNRKDDVEVAMLQHPDDPSCPYVRMKAIIPVPVEECWNFLLVSRWDETMPRMGK